MKFNISILDNSDLFEVGEIEFESCDGSPMVANAITGLISKQSIEKSLKDSADAWLQQDIIATLKSSNNFDLKDFLSF